MALEKEIDLVRNGLRDSFLTVRVGATGEVGGSFVYNVGSGTTLVQSGLNMIRSTLAHIQSVNAVSGTNIGGILPPVGESHVDGRHIRIYNLPIGVNDGIINFRHLFGAGVDSMASVNGDTVQVCPYGYVDCIYDGDFNHTQSSIAGWRML